MAFRTIPTVHQPRPVSVKACVQIDQRGSKTLRTEL